MISEQERYRLLFDLARQFAATANDYSALVSLIAQRLSETFGDLCMLRLLSADGRFLEPSDAVYHPDPEVAALGRAAAANVQAVTEGLTGRVATTGQSVLVPALDMPRLLASLEPSRRAFLERQSVTSVAIAPLLARGASLGVVSLSRSDPAKPLDDTDLRLLEDAAALAALAIDSARSQKALQESVEAHRLLFDESPVPIFVFDIDSSSPIAANDAALALYGFTEDEFLRLDVRQLGVSDGESVRAWQAPWGTDQGSGVTQHLRKDGTTFTGRYASRRVTFRGRNARMLAIEDVTARFEAEAARALLAAIVQSSNDAIVSKTLDGTITSWNRAAERLFGYTAEEVIGRPITMLIPEERQDEEAALIERITTRERIEHFETVRKRKDGSEVYVSISLAPILDGAGNVIGASKTVRDLTAQRGAEQSLKRAEGQLRQSQKMEAVGRLAGGIAHDFNNMLSVILSYSSILLDELKPNDPAAEDLEEIRKAGARAADLTRQLLVFSRQQVVQAKVVDLNEILRSMTKMLDRVLGEDVDLAAILGQDLGRIRADPGNVEQVIMNLVVNARDAMPTGGQLTIETVNVHLDERHAREHVGSKDGPHVMLAVTDTGFGMDEATQARIFEPFFTTKEAGKGTGLGLSTVFGIVQQAGGSVWVYSEPGKGTTFKVYFPRIDEKADAATVAHAFVSLRGTETVLLVEDQDLVRTVAHGILRRSGYTVIVARNAGEALLVCEQHRGTIHLLLTDVVMPQMSGAELARRIALARPEAKVLCMSGYTDDSVVRHGVLQSGMAFLQKPFTPESLTRKVRELLDAPVAVPPPSPAG